MAPIIGRQSKMSSGIIKSEAITLRLLAALLIDQSLNSTAVISKIVFNKARGLFVFALLSIA